MGSGYGSNISESLSIRYTILVRDFCPKKWPGVEKKTQGKKQAIMFLLLEKWVVMVQPSNWEGKTHTGWVSTFHESMSLEGLVANKPALYACWTCATCLGNL
jgi:hypothetical protein